MLMAVGTYVTYERGVSEGRPDISVLVELTVLSKLWKKINMSVHSGPLNFHDPYLFPGRRYSHLGLQRKNKTKTHKPDRKSHS